MNAKKNAPSALLRQRLFGSLIVEEKENLSEFGWFDDWSEDAIPQSPDEEAPRQTSTQKPQKTRAMKKKVSDAILPEFNHPTSIHVQASLAARRRRKLRIFSSGMLIVFLVLAPVYILLSSSRKETRRKASLRSAAALLRLRPFEAMTTKKFVQGTEELGPLFERIGLSRAVNVNLVKLRTAGLDETIENHLKKEAAAGISDKDEAATVAVLWNGRLLDFIRELIECVLASDLLNEKSSLSSVDIISEPVSTPESTVPPSSDSTSDHKKMNWLATLRGLAQKHKHTQRKQSTTSLATLARQAYDSTLKQHHNRVLRSAAHTLLAFSPDHATFFSNHLGYQPELWSTELRADLKETADTLRDCLNVIRALLKKHTHFQL